MASRKSAAQLKLKKEQENTMEELMPIVDMFDNAKEMYVMTAENNVLTAKRIDNLMNIRDFAKKFWGENYEVTVDYCKELQALSVKTYEAIVEVAKTFELEEFQSEDMKDYFEDLVPKCEDVNDEDGLCAAALIYLTIRPYGEKMLQLHQLILDEVEKRKVEEEE